MEKIAVLGDGGWGTALALLLFGKSKKVRVWGAFPKYIEEIKQKHLNVKFLPGVPLPTELEFTSDPEKAAEYHDAWIMAIPTQFARATLEKFRAHYKKNTPVISVSKGLENDTLKRNTEIVREVLGAKEVAALSGPSHAEEVARKLPTVVSVASEIGGLALKVQQMFMTPRFRVYTNEDVVGVEVGGAVKNVIAIAAGMCEGLGLGDNAKAALLTRGVAELARLGVAMGGKPDTFAGLSGLGDLITTCYSPHGRNREVGLRLGKGTKLPDILKTMEKVAEGITTVKSVVDLARRHNIEMPISQEVYRILYDGKDPLVAVNDLMVRDPKAEKW